MGPAVTGGFVGHPFERARDVLRFFRDLAAEAPDDLTLVAGLLHGPDGSKLAAIAMCHCGDLPAGAHEFRWNGRADGDAAVAAGSYFVILEVGGRREARRLTVLGQVR